MSKTQSAVRRTHRSVRNKAKGNGRVIAIEGLGSNNTFQNCKIELGSYNEIADKREAKRDVWNVLRKMVGIVVTVMIGIAHTISYNLR